ncbi:HAD family hydrolase [Neolewinella persica]|uniref:HAD family hydrolase n=1 Tax=Neolewinella persica TaxID=70998 RepID=UPI00036A19E9|nr:HAD family hydrolase [Neolewinella persica]
MIDLSNLTHIAFDADDTLWAHENVFVDAKARCVELLRPYLQPKHNLEEELYRFERKNLKLFGYGVKGFTLSMIETAIELSNGKITGAEIQRIIDLAKEMLDHPIHLLDYVPEAIAALKPHFTLLVITKGDLFAQENKIARSGLAKEFDIIEIVSEKDEATYRSLLQRYSIDPAHFLMLGNSLRSDVLPIINIGGRALHLPFEFTWHHEAVMETAEEYWQPDSLWVGVEAILAARG